MSTLNIPSQDIDPEESISQIYGSSLTASSSRAIFPGLDTASAGFRSQFASSPRDLGDNFLLIENDPVTLARAKSILGVYLIFCID